MNTDMRTPELKMGIIGTGRIAERFIPEAAHVKGLSIIAVYNPRFTSAKRFAEKHALSFATGSEADFYEKVDAVYIASPHETHYEYIIHALEHGKHVWCEKPMVLRKDQAIEVFSLAKQLNLLLMEGIKTAYCPGFLQVLEIAKSGRIGEIRDVEGAFTKLVNDEECREIQDVRFGGSFTELGSYPLLAIVKLLGKDYQKVHFESFRNDKGVDLYTKAYLRFNNAIATAKTGLGVKSEGQLLISGTEGYIRVNAPWWKTTSFEVCYEDSSQNEQFTNEYAGDGLRYGLQEFVAAVNGSNDGIIKLPVEESVAIADVIEAFRFSRKYS